MPIELISSFEISNVDMSVVLFKVRIWSNLFLSHQSLRSCTHEPAFHLSAVDGLKRWYGTFLLHYSYLVVSKHVSKGMKTVYVASMKILIRGLWSNGQKNWWALFMRSGHAGKDQQWDHMWGIHWPVEDIKFVLSSHGCLRYRRSLPFILPFFLPCFHQYTLFHIHPFQQLARLWSHFEDIYRWQIWQI